jgi:hypothetical protein
MAKKKGTFSIQPMVEVAVIPPKGHKKANSFYHDFLDFLKEQHIHPSRDLMNMFEIIERYPKEDAEKIEKWLLEKGIEKRTFMAGIR